MSREPINVIDFIYHKPGHHKAVTLIRAFEDFIVTGGKDGRIIIWDSELSKEIGYLFAHKSEMTDVLYDPNYNIMYSAARENNIKLWVHPVFHYKGETKAHSATLLGIKTWKEYLLSASRDNYIKKWILEDFTLKQIAKVSVEKLSDFIIVDNHLVTFSSDGLLSVYSLPSLEFEKYLKFDVSSVLRAIRKASKNFQSINRSDAYNILLKISRENGIPVVKGGLTTDKLVLAHNFGLVTLWSRSKLKFKVAFYIHDEHITDLAVFSDYLITSSLNKTIVKTDLSLKTPSFYKKLSSRPLALDITPSGKLIVGLETGALLCLSKEFEVLLEHKNVSAVSCCCITPVNIIVALVNGKIKLINPETLSDSRTHNIHKKRIEGIFYHKNKIVSIGSEKLLKIFDLRFNEIKTIPFSAIPKDVESVGRYIAITKNLAFDIEKEEFIKGEISKQTKKDYNEKLVHHYNYIRGDCIIKIDVSKLDYVETKGRDAIYDEGTLTFLRKLVKTNTKKRLFAKMSSHTILSSEYLETIETTK